ncbi:unnamed protein product, partial [Meganyctiphanes norvegica]
MKRRNVDCAKLRRPLKRTKIGEGLYGSSFVYIKFLLVWLLVLAADFLLEFRFEYLWPFWLLLRSVYDSFRYQGLAFSVLFVCMALTSDMICLLFIPVNWLFFAASTYVWVQFVWHTERGVCMPTVILWALFIYIEALVRLKDIKNVPFHLDLCRPFAAHCIGYPVVTLGFGLKSYVGYRLRQRKQREVSKENEFYLQLLQEALPPELQVSSSPDTGLKEKSEDLNLSGEVEVPVSQNHTGGGNSSINSSSVVSSSSSCSSSSSSSSSCSSERSTSSNSGGGRSNRVRVDSRLPDTQQQHPSIQQNTQTNHQIPQADESTPPPPSHRTDKNRLPNGTIHAELEFMQKKGWPNSRSVNDYDENEAERDKSIKSTVSGNTAPVPHLPSSPITTNVDSDKKRSNASHSQSNGSAKIPGSHTNNLRDTGSGSTGSQARDKKNKNKESNKDSSQKDDSVSIIRLEADIKRLKADLQASRQTEQELRNQVNSLISNDKMTNQELGQVQQDNDNLQNKLHGLVTARQTDRSNISNLERRLGEERRQRQQAEERVAQLERRHKKVEEQAQATRHALANAKGECSESCRSRRSELEADVKRLRREQRLGEERHRNLERENMTLRQYKDNQNDTEVKMIIEYCNYISIQTENPEIEINFKTNAKI